MICGAGVPRFPPSPGERTFIQGLIKTCETLLKPHLNSYDMDVLETKDLKVDLTPNEQTPQQILLAYLRRQTDWSYENQADISNYKKVFECFHQLLGEILRNDKIAAENSILFQTKNGPPQPSTNETIVDIAWKLNEKELLAAEILRVTSFIVENAINKHLYPSIDYVVFLLAAKNDELARLAVKLIAMLSLPPLSHRIPTDSQNQSESPAVGNSALKKHLMIYAEGTSDVSSSRLIMSDYFRDDAAFNETGSYVFYRYDETLNDSTLVSIELPKFTPSAQANDIAQAFLQLIEQYHVPEKHHFKLLYRLRWSISQQARHLREMALIDRLHAFTALFNFFGDSYEVTQYLEQHGDLTTELLELVRMDSKEEAPLEVRVAALETLTALVNDKRARGVGSVGRNSTLLSSLGIMRGAPSSSFVALVRHCLGELVIGEKSTDMDMNLAVAFVEATTEHETTPFRDLSSAQDRKLYWIENVLSLICSVVGIQGGATLLTESGIIPSLLHAISCPSVSPLHTSILVQAIQTLESTMTHHAPAAVLFRDLNGVTILVDRLMVEANTSDMSDTKQVLIIALLSMLSASFHTQGVMSAGTTSRMIREGSNLNKALSTILGKIDLFGPVVYAQATTLLADVINNDPTCVNHVHTSGLADIFLTTISRWDLTTSTNALPPCPELIIAIPNVISALCLTNTYVDKVAQTKPLLYLLDMFTMIDYVDEIDYFQGEVASIVGGGLDELMRHVPAFARLTIEACVTSLKKIAQISASHPVLLKMTLHVCDVLEPVLGKSEHAGQFADLGGVDTLFSLYERILPSPATFLLNASNENSPLSHYSTSQSITMATRAYASQHPALMLGKVMANILKQLDLLAQTYPNHAIGVISKVQDLPSLESIDDQPGAIAAGSFLRTISHIEWMVSLVIWTIRSAQSHSQNRRWLSEFTSTSNCEILSRLFSLDRTIQIERVSVDEKLELASPSNDKGLWKVSSLLLLKFSLMVRNLVSKFGRLFFASRFSDDIFGTTSTSQVATSTQLLIDVHLNVLDTMMGINERYVRHGGITFLVESLSSLLFEGKRGTTNTLLIHVFLEKKVLERIIQALTSAVVDCLQIVETLSKHDTRLCQTAAQFLKKTADIQSLASTSISSWNGSKIDIQALKIQLHTTTMESIINIWSHPSFQQADKCIGYFIPVVATLLKQRLDLDKKTTEKSLDQTKIDTSIVESLTMMGFASSHAELALRQIEVNDVEMAMEWMLVHPEDEFRAQLQTASPTIIESEMKVPTYQTLRTSVCAIALTITKNEATVKALGDLLLLVSTQSDEGEESVVSMLCNHIVQLSLDELESISHLLALLVHGDTSVRSLAANHGCVSHLVDLVTKSSFQSELHDAIAPILLVMDALTQEESFQQENRYHLIDSCIRFMNLSTVSSHGGHSIWQLVVRLTRDVDVVERFVASNGVETCLNRNSSFDGYKELTSAILAHVLEYPQVLQARMEEKIIQSMRKLTSRIGSAGQSRIQPRNLLSELGMVALRDEKLFLSAMKETVEVKKSDSGRLYVILKENELVGQKKLSQLPIPNASTVMKLIVQRIESLWTTYDKMTGTYLFFLVHLVTLFPACGISLLNEHGGFLSLVLRELLPCRELTQIMASKDDKSLNEYAKIRVHNAHRLMVRLCTQEGCKKILLELCRLLETWPGKEENKTNALSSLHAWCALIMTILWPREDKERGLMWENAKTFLKKDIVQSLFNALSAIDKSHPLARSTCTMVLRPLASFTRPWISQRIRKLKKKESIEIPSQEERSSVEYEEMRMSNLDEEDESQRSESSGDDDDDEEDDEENEEDDEEEEDDDEDDDDDDDSEIHGEDVDLLQAENDFRSTRQRHHSLWDALDADLSLLDENHQSRRQEPAEEDRRSIFDLFSFHQTNGTRQPRQWSHIFREFEQDLSNQEDLRDLEEDDTADILTIPFDTLQRDGNRFRSIGHRTIPSQHQSNGSLAGLTHPLLSHAREHRDSHSHRPPSRHHEFSRQMISNSMEQLQASLWSRDEQQSNVRQVVQRMEQELAELVVEPSPMDPSPEEDTASVQAITSTLGESTLQSPPDTSMSESPPPTHVEEDPTESMITDSVNEERSVESPQEDRSIDSIPVVPPPAPVAPPSMLNFTLDFGAIPPPPPQVNSDVSDASNQLECPEGMDPEVFHSLPPDMQSEIIAANAPQVTRPSTDILESQYDRETLDALPADIREEILANERREREAASAPPPDISLAQEMDNASFVASLAPDLREEILITADDAFLQTLPSSVRAEATVLRERAAFRSVQSHIRNEDDGGNFFQRPTLRRMLTSHGSDLAPTNRRTSRRSESTRPLIPPVEDITKQGLIQVEKDENVDYMMEINEKSIENLLSCLFMTQSILHHRVYQTVLKNLCQYKNTRKYLCKNILKILNGNKNNELFPPKTMIGCISNGINSNTILPDVLPRILNVLISLTKENIRLNINFLENGILNIINLLNIDIILKNCNYIEMVLEIIDSILNLFLRYGTINNNKNEIINLMDEKEWISIPLLLLSLNEINSFIFILNLDICNIKIQNYIINILKNLKNIKKNKLIILNGIINNIKNLIEIISIQLNKPKLEIKLLRLFHTLSDLCDTTEEFNIQIQKIYLNDLWNILTKSLDDARKTDGLFDDIKETEFILSPGASCAMGAILTRYLPLIEIFFIVHARDAVDMILIPCNIDDEKHGNQLALFVEKNRILLNMLIREKSSLLDNTLAAMIKIPPCRAFLDFDNKRTYFQNAMKRLKHSSLRSQGGGGHSVRISIRRDRVFEDSFYALRMRSGNELRRKLHISFTGEEGIDAGGVTREWYMILAREIFNPNYALFTCAADSPTFQPNPLSFVNKDHLNYFEFVGKIIGKAIADGQLLDAHFTRSFYKHILQLPLNYSDMETIDPEYYRNLHLILENKIVDLNLDLTFSIEHSNFGKIEIVDLILNGRNISVTDENKMEYVKLITNHRMATGIRCQIDSFLNGFHQLVSPQLISIFNENELELLISGMPEIDIDDLKANTDYSNYKPIDNPIRWFWNVLDSFTHEERALFLQFVTGTSKVPLEGFKALEGMRGTQKFNIHKAFGSSDSLPTAHTCFNQLDLPQYESEEQLKTRLLLAIREGSEGFGFG